MSASTPPPPQPDVVYRPMPEAQQSALAAQQANMIAIKLRLEAKNRERLAAAAVAKRIVNTTPQLPPLPPLPSSSMSQQAAAAPAAPRKRAKTHTFQATKPDDLTPGAMLLDDEERSFDEEGDNGSSLAEFLDPGYDSDPLAADAAAAAHDDDDDDRPLRRGKAVHEDDDNDDDGDGKAAPEAEEAKKQGSRQQKEPRLPPRLRDPDIAEVHREARDAVAQPSIVIHVSGGAAAGGGSGRVSIPTAVNRENQIRARVLQQDPELRHRYFFAAGLDDEEHVRRDQFEQAHEVRVRAVFGAPGAPGRPAEDDFSSVADSDDDDDGARDDMTLEGSADDEQLPSGYLKQVNRVERKRRRNHLPPIDAAAAEDLLTPCWICGTKDMDDTQSSDTIAKVAPVDYVFSSISEVVAHYMGCRSLWTAATLGAIYYYNFIYRKLGGRAYFLTPREVYVSLCEGVRPFVFACGFFGVAKSTK